MASPLLPPSLSTRSFSISQRFSKATKQEALKYGIPPRNNRSLRALDHIAILRTSRTLKGTPKATADHADRVVVTSHGVPTIGGFQSIIATSSTARVTEPLSDNS